MMYVKHICGIFLMVPLSLSLATVLPAQDATDSASVCPSDVSRDTFECVQDLLRQLRVDGHGKKADVLATELKYALSKIETRIRQNHDFVDDAKIQKARRTIAELNEVGASDDAARLVEDLARIEHGLNTGEYDFGKDVTTPAVHSILVRNLDQIRQPPNAVSMPWSLPGPPHLQWQDAEIHVESTGEPVILVVGAAKPTRWKVVRHPEADIHSVLAVGRNQEITGLTDTIVADTNKFYFDEQDILYFLGFPGTTHQAVGRLFDEPFVIGPSSKWWRWLYFAPKLDGLIDQAEAEIAKRRSAPFQNVRFQAFRRRSPVLSYGDFSVFGPLLETHESLCWNSPWQYTCANDGEKRSFYAVADQPTSYGHIHLLRRGTASVELPPPPRTSGGSQPDFRVTAYDSKRHVLVAVCRRTNTLFAYRDNQCFELNVLPVSIKALTYDPVRDRFFGVISPPFWPRDQRPYIVRLSPEGKVESQIPMTADYRLLSSPQLAIVDHMVVVLSRESVRVGKNWTTAEWTSSGSVRQYERIRIFDIESGRSLYSARLQGPSVDYWTPRTPQSPIGWLEHKLRRAAEEINLIRKNDRPRAETLSQRLTLLRKALHGPLPLRPERLYLINMEQSQCSVRVTDTSGPITLALASSRSYSTWSVEVGEGVELRRVIVGGIQPQLAQVPDGVETIIVPSTRQEGELLIRLTEGYARATTTLRRFTDLPIAAIFSTGFNDGGNVIIGHGNGNWHAKALVGEIDLLLQEITRDSDRLRAVPHARFQAVTFGRTGQRGDTNSSFVTTFTIDGPVANSDLPIPIPLTGVTTGIDGSIYGRDDSTVYSIDGQTGHAVPIPIAKELLGGGSIQGLTFDTKRRRLLAATVPSRARSRYAVPPAQRGSYRPIPLLLTCDLQSKKWEVLAELPTKPSGLAYAENEDAIYLFDGNLRRCAATGVEIDQVPVWHRPAIGGKNQVLCAAGHIIVVSHEDGPENTAPIRRVTVIDPATGIVLYDSVAG